jgi:hypothetical protein
MPRGTSPLDEARLQGRLWTPAGQSALWLDPADPSAFSFGTGISDWRDKGGNGRNATQATGANQPTLTAAALNGLPLVRFDGLNDILIANFGAALQVTNFSITWLMVRRGTGTGDTYQPSLAGWDSAGTNVGGYHFIKSNNLLGASVPHVTWGNYDLGSGTAYANGRPEIITFSAETTSWRVLRNGVQEGITGTIPSANTVIDGISIGGSINPARYSLIDCGDVISFIGNTRQNGIQQQKARGFIAWKYGLQNTNLPASDPYRNRPPLIGD